MCVIGMYIKTINQGILLIFLYKSLLDVYF